MKRILALTLLTFSSASFATPLDLSSWTEHTYDLTGGQSAGNWVLSGSNTTVTQTTNADPSFYRNNNNLTAYTMDGSWQVTTASDDDFIGFVFGYQNDQQYYVMDWKQAYQNAGGTYGIADAGFRILKIDALAGDGNLVLKDFWGSGTVNSEVIASNTGAGKGWADNTSYDFHLDFRKASGDIAIQVMQGESTLWDVVLVDNSFSSGEFGFYNFSQASVEYSGFEQTGGIPGEVPIPAAAFLFAPALLGFMGFRRRAKNLAA